MNEILIQILVPIATAGAGTFFSWFFTKRKYKVEVKTAEAQSQQVMQDTYQEIIQDLRQQISELRKEVNENKAKADEQEKALHLMRQAMYNMLEQTCELECNKRKPMTLEKYKNIMDELESI